MAVKATALITLTRVNDGATGPKGNDGKGIKSTSITYQAWDNGTNPPPSNSGWVTTPPKTTASKPYLWTKTVLTYTDNTSSPPSYSVGSTPEGIVVGGRNLIKGTTNTWIEVNTGQWYTNIIAQVKPIELYGLKVGDTVTFSVDINGGEHGAISRFTFYSDIKGTTDKVAYTGNLISKGTIGKSVITHTITSKELYVELCMQNGETTYTSNVIKYKGPKLEIGNKATDWTPAPEDVDNAINEEHTDRQSAIEAKANEITSKVSETYVSNSAFEHYQKDLSTQFTQTKKDFTWSINQSVIDIKNEMNGQINDVNGRVDGLKVTTDNVNSYMSFDKEALTLGKSGNAFKTQITNQEWAILKNEEKLTYINDKTVYITDGQFTESLKVGNFGFVPRANGSLDFKKIR